jgi:tryptophan halogenase
MKKIIIVGGGTAGWLAAFYILKKNPNYNITVVESSDLGIIGVGEGGTHIIGGFINSKDIDINFKEFMTETEATFKLGFKHENWIANGTHYFNPLDLNASYDTTIDDRLAWQILKEEPIHKITPLGMFINEQRSVLKEDETGIADTPGISYHFNAHKVGKFFKKKVLEQGGNVIDAVVTTVNLDLLGNISSLNLSNGSVVHGDFFIDCSGFKRVLVNEVGAKWVSYKKHLLMNSALPFSLPYEAPVWPEPFSRSYTMSSGWVWEIPTAHRFGCGYVFCDQFLSFEQAHQELEIKLDRKIEPIKQIKFEAGRLDNAWTKNCLSLGLASAFIEPLEATSIHATTIQIKKFVEYFANEEQDKYNKEIRELYDEIKDYIVLHYQGGKTDSLFWEYIANNDIATDFVKNIIDISKHRLLKKDDVPNNADSIGYQAWNQVLAGMGFINKDTALKHLNGKEISNSWQAIQISKMDIYKTNKNIVLNGYFTK